MNRRDLLKPKFDFADGKEIVDAFTYSSGVACRLCTVAGSQLYVQNGPGGGCAFRDKLLELTGAELRCEGLHSYAIKQSERFGGRYIYFCPLGMSFVASPIMIGGALVGALIAGPAMIMQLEDLIACDALHAEELDQEHLSILKELLLDVPQMDPRRLEHISNQLFANAVYLSDSGHELFMSRGGWELDSAIEEYISRLSSGEKNVGYPIQTEQELTNTIMRGDKESSRKLLGKILGYIFSSYKETEEQRIKVQELFVIMSRAAIAGGADTKQCLDICEKFLRKLSKLSARRDFSRYLSSYLSRFCDLVSSPPEVKHTNAIDRAFDYMKREYARKLSLNEVAQHVGYSPSYFSRVFREEVGVTFKESLNGLRIEESKVLLLSTTFPVSEICTMTGFNDQSYFCKTFKHFAGVTPDMFRKRVRRIDSRKEYGLK